MLYDTPAARESKGRGPTPMRACATTPKREGEQKMSKSIKRLSYAAVSATFAVILLAQQSYAGAGSPPPGEGSNQHPPSTVWHVRYMGGPQMLKRGTHVELEITTRPSATVPRAPLRGRIFRSRSRPSAAFPTETFKVIARLRCLALTTLTSSALVNTYGRILPPLASSAALRSRPPSQSSRIFFQPSPTRIAS